MHLCGGLAVWFVYRVVHCCVWILVGFCVYVCLVCCLVSGPLWAVGGLLVVVGWFVTCLAQAHVLITLG